MGAPDPPLRVLVIGLDPYRVPGPWDPAPVAEAIERGISRFAEHDVGVQTCLIGLDGSDDIAAVLSQALCAQRWECVVIGGGIRSSDDQVQLFEQVINSVRYHAADAAIAFNCTPEDTFEAAARWIGSRTASPGAVTPWTEGDAAFARLDHDCQHGLNQRSGLCLRLDISPADISRSIPKRSRTFTREPTSPESSVR